MSVEPQSISLTDGSGCRKVVVVVRHKRQLEAARIITCMPGHLVIRIVASVLCTSR